MVGENTNVRSPLLPLRHEQGDFFVCDIFDAAPKGDTASMAHPIFSLSTKPDTRPRHYESTDGQSFVEIKPSSDGLATVHDRDVLIYCISQVMAAINQGREISKTLRFKAYDLLVATNRGTDGRGYEQLRAAFERLRGTTISTNIVTGGKEQFDVFGLIDRARIVRETRDGRMQDVEIVLSDWVFNAIQGHEVLTLNRRYFQLRKPLERRLYELARKHCGHQKEWKIGLEKLRLKTGSSSTAKEFKRLLAKIIEDDQTHGHMPDYQFELRADIVVVSPKPEFTDAYTEEKPQLALFLKAETYERAKEAALGWDVHYLETEWRDWMTEPPRSPDGAFIGFCRKWFEKRGRP
ncbi:MAG: replication initiator protein A [Pseudomonadota bacterium]